MSKTSIKDYTIAGITAGFVVTIIILAVLSIPSVFNTEGFDNTSFSDYDNLTAYTELVNDTSSETYDTTADAGAFDVLGQLVVKGFEAVKSFFNSINFLQSSLGTMLNGLGLKVSLDAVVSYIVGVISVSLAIYFLIKVIIKTEDEK